MSGADTKIRNKEERRKAASCLINAPFTPARARDLLLFLWLCRGLGKDKKHSYCHIGIETSSNVFYVSIWKYVGLFCIVASVPFPPPPSMLHWHTPKEKGKKEEESIIIPPGGKGRKGGRPASIHLEAILWKKKITKYWGAKNHNMALSKKRRKVCMNNKI